MWCGQKKEKQKGKETEVREKTQEIEEEKTTQEAVNENLKNIDTLNDLA